MWLPVTGVGWRSQSPESVQLLPSGCCHTNKNKRQLNTRTSKTTMVKTMLLLLHREECTLKPSSTRSWRLSAACVQVMAMILASFTSRYLERSSPLLSSSNALNSFQGQQQRKNGSGEMFDKTDWGNRWLKKCNKVKKKNKKNKQTCSTLERTYYYIVIYSPIWVKFCAVHWGCAGTL